MFYDNNDYDEFFIDDEVESDADDTSNVEELLENEAGEVSEDYVNAEVGNSIHYADDQEVLNIFPVNISKKVEDIKLSTQSPILRKCEN